jgi:hypothetical protein
VRLLNYINNVGEVMSEKITLRKREDEVIKAGTEIKYFSA